MNFKALAKIFFIFLVLAISVGIVSAENNESIQLSAPASEMDRSILRDDDWDDDDDDWDDDWDDDDYWEGYYGHYKKPTAKIPKGKIKTDVDADPIAVKYKKNSYFKIKVENRYDDDIPIKKVKLKVKVGTGSKAKTFKVKTNSYGVAKINTKSLKNGVHKVVITSLDKKYDISKRSKIVVSKQYTSTIKGTSTKVLKNRDVVGVKMRYDDDDIEYKIKFKKKSKNTKILKAVFYFKNTFTGQVIVKVDRAEFDDGRWEMPEEDAPYNFRLMKVKLHYISTK